MLWGVIMELQEMRMCDQVVAQEQRAQRGWRHMDRLAFQAWSGINPVCYCRSDMEIRGQMGASTGLIRDCGLAWMDHGWKAIKNEKGEWKRTAMWARLRRRKKKRHCKVDMQAKIVEDWEILAFWSYSCFSALWYCFNDLWSPKGRFIRAWE